MRAMWIDTHCHLDAPSSMPTATRSSTARARGRRRPDRAAGGGGGELRGRARRWRTRHGAGLRARHPPAVRRPRRRRRPGPPAPTRCARQRDDPRLVAVGEIGLDHFVPGLDRARQERFYAAQLGWRASRPAGDPARAPLGRRAAQAPARASPVRGGIAHAFNGSAQQAQAFVGAGLQARLRRRDDLRARAADPRASRATLPLEAHRAGDRRAGHPAAVALPHAPTSAPAGATTRNEPAELPRIAAVLAELRGLRRWRRWPRPPRANALRRAAAPGRLRRMTRRHAPGDRPATAAAGRRARRPAARDRAPHPAGRAGQLSGRRRRSRRSSTTATRATSSGRSCRRIWGVDLRGAAATAGGWPTLRARGLGHVGRLRRLPARGQPGQRDRGGRAQRPGQPAPARAAAAARWPTTAASRRARCAITRALGVAVLRLPSTSPANASWSFERKLAAWRARLRRARPRMSGA